MLLMCRRPRGSHSLHQSGTFFRPSQRFELFALGPGAGVGEQVGGSGCEAAFEDARGCEAEVVEFVPCL